MAIITVQPALIPVAAVPKTASVIQPAMIPVAANTGNRKIVMAQPAMIPVASQPRA